MLLQLSMPIKPDWRERVPAYLTMAAMPFCYSISEGIAVGAISLTGKDNEILQAIMKVYVPYIILLGAIVYFGQVLVG